MGVAMTYTPPLAGAPNSQDISLWQSDGAIAIHVRDRNHWVSAFTGQ